MTDHNSAEAHDMAVKGAAQFTIRSLQIATKAYNSCPRHTIDSVILSLVVTAFVNRPEVLGEGELQEHMHSIILEAMELSRQPRALLMVDPASAPRN